MNKIIAAMLFSIYSQEHANMMMDTEKIDYYFIIIIEKKKVQKNNNYIDMFLHSLQTVN